MVQGVGYRYFAQRSAATHQVHGYIKNLADGRVEAFAQGSEKQVNGILTQYNEDYATLRRNLVEYGFMRRERGGGDYWLTPENEG